MTTDTPATTELGPATAVLGDGERAAITAAVDQRLEHHLATLLTILRDQLAAELRAAGYPDAADHLLRDQP